MTGGPGNGGASSLQAELLALWARQGRRLPLPNVFAATIFAAMAWGHLPFALLVGWVALVVLLQGVRWRVMSRWDRLAALPPARQERTAVALNAANGVVFALSIGFMPFVPEAVRALQSMVLAGLAAGSAITAGYGRVFVAFAAPIMLPLVLMWAFGPTVAGKPWIGPMAALLILAFGGMITVFARDVMRVFSNYFDSRREQQRLNEELRLTLEREEAASRAKTRFLASASHDLRQPLHTVALFAAALTMRPLDERSREIATSINEALQDLASELDALLDVSKLDAGVVQVNLERVDLARLLGRLRDAIAPVARQKGLEVLLRCPAGAWVHTDRMLMERVLRNLLDNAVKYTDSGWISLEAIERGAQMEITIRDTGCGIPEAERHKVFEEFYQIDNSERDRRKGLGLGLSIVRRLTELLGIGMTLQSEAAVGSRFILTVAGGVSQQEVAEPAAPPRATRLRPLHVLVVDDEASVRRGMRSLLEAIGCRVTLARDTGEAVAAARKTPVDLVMADFRLHDDDGLNTVAALRRLQPGLPALLISGDTAPERLREAHEAGIPMLHKPVNVEDLTRVIGDLSERVGTGGDDPRDARSAPAAG